MCEVQTIHYSSQSSLLYPYRIDPFIFAYTYLHADRMTDYLYAAFLLAVMEITDFLDGFIARRYHMITDVGKIIDPIADKLLQLTLLVPSVVSLSFSRLCIGPVFDQKPAWLYADCFQSEKKMPAGRRFMVRKDLNDRILYLHDRIDPVP